MTLRILKFFEKNQPIHKSYFRLPKIVLGFLGFWPENSNNNFLLKCWTFFNYLILSCAALSETAYGLSHFDQPLLALEAFCPSITKLTTVLKLSLIFYQKKRLTKLIRNIQESLQKEVNDEEKEKIYKSAAQTATLLATFVFAFGNSTSGFYFFRPIFSNLFQYFRNENMTRILPFTGVVPNNAYEYPYYPIYYILFTHSANVTVFGFGGVDGSFFGFCSYISVLYRIIQIDVRNTLRSSDDDPSERENNEKFYKMKDIIRRHNEIISLTNEFVSCFSVIIMGYFLSAAIIICISSFQLLKASGFNLFLYVSYTIAALMQILVYCIGGTFVYENSIKIATVSYFSEWYKYDKRIKDMILLIIIRAQRGSPVKVPFFAPSLTAFGTILSTAGSYIALLKTVI